MAWGIREMVRANKARAAQAAEDSKVTQVTLKALEELVRRASPPRLSPAE